MLANKIFIAYLLTLLAGTEASHFRGGWITWKAISETATTVTLEFKAYWSWNRQTYFCDLNTINSQSLIGPPSPISCKLGCSVSGESIGNTQFYCTAYSASESWTYGERTFTYTIKKVASYIASFASCCWISLYNGAAPSWEISININALTRADTGKVNSSPVTTIFPVFRVRLGMSSTITIPVSDADNDVVRCRWSDSTKGECGGICGIPPGATLDQNKCEIFFNAATSTPGWYALSLSIEDFASSSSTTALSTVVIQFMVLVGSSASSCTTA